MNAMSRKRPAPLKLLRRVLPCVLLGLLTSGCPMMMIPMMVGMGGNQHQEPPKNPPAEDTATQSRQQSQH